jgi:hypothetical protein
MGDNKTIQEFLTDYDSSQLLICRLYNKYALADNRLANFTISKADCFPLH